LVALTHERDPGLRLVGEGEDGVGGVLSSIPASSMSRASGR
jgi:hypothetical protein